MSGPLHYAVAGAVATVTLARPEARNALDTRLKEALLAALREAGGDPAVRAVVLAGSGRAFCVGQDLTEHAAALAADPGGVWRTVPEHYNPIVLALAGMPKPVVAAVNGVAAGAGASFALACDFRVLARGASFTLAFAGVGLGADSGASWTLPRLVGWARARELLMLPGASLGAEEARAAGLATLVVDDGEAVAAATELAARLAAGPTAAYAAIRATLDYAAAHPLEETLAYEATRQAAVGATVDHREAVAAFAAKRPPTFTGR